MSESKALTKGNGNQLRVWLTGDAFREQVKMSLPAHLKPERFIRVALTAMTRTPDLAKCTQESFFKCLLDLSAAGLEPDGRRAHLIPYRNNKAGTTECTLIIDYKGLVELIMRSGLVSSIHADVVCDADVFEYNMGEITKHTINFREPRGKVYAAYATCRMKDGTSKTEVMTVEEIERIRKRSRAGQSGPWVTDWNEMAKKTVFRRLSKWLPLSAEFRDAVEKDDDVLDTQARPVGDMPTSLDNLANSMAANHDEEPGEADNVIDLPEAEADELV